MVYMSGFINGWSINLIGGGGWATKVGFLRGPHGDFLENFDFFRFFDFSGPAPVLGVLDIALSIPEVW